MKSLRSAWASLICAMVILCSAPIADASSSLSITVTPPLFQLTISPGQSWSSSLKVVNANAYEVTYYAQSMDFSAQGEGGQASFAPVVNVPGDTTSNTFSLANWVQLSPGPYTIPAGRSAEIPFTVSIPANAEPGGHYAAILVGTQPPDGSVQGSLVKISSYVSSLLFVKVEGNITESARIREFRTNTTLYQTSDADFLLRFENLGNTHLRPEGVITIYNMWGKKRGEVMINQASNFGNVLPKSIRKFEFTWSGDDSIFDIGQYSAIVTLNFGDEGKQNISATAYFWVVPMVPVATTVGSVVVVLVMMFWLIRRYVRRALLLEQRRAGTVERSDALTVSHPVPVDSYSLQTLIEPIKEGVIDLRRVSASVGTKLEPVQSSTMSKVALNETGRLSAWDFLLRYKLFFVFILVLLFTSIAVYVFFAKVLVPENTYQIKHVSSQVEG